MSHLTEVTLLYKSSVLFTGIKFSFKRKVYVKDKFNSEQEVDSYLSDLFKMGSQRKRDEISVKPFNFEDIPGQANKACSL